jgi:hypothetical protein
MTFELSLSQTNKRVSVYLYIGSIGMRGNLPTFADGLSRFLVVRLAARPITGNTQYGFHKHLCTAERTLLPHHEIPFPGTLSVAQRQEVYRALENFGYRVVDGAGAKKQLLIGEIALDSPQIEIQLGNLLEYLFALAVVKEHFKRRQFSLPFLDQ